MTATAIHRLALDPMGKCSNAFFSETTNMIKAKLYMNVHWMVLYKSLKPLGQLKANCPGMIIGRSSTKFLFFYADRKFKMAATAVHRLTLDPMGKCSNAFFSETINMIKVKLYMNVH